jgi:Histidine kinase-like ATPase domain
VCRQATLDLPALPSSPGAARRFLTETCRRWELPGLRDNLALAVSELVTNSVLHARTPIRVAGSVAQGLVEIGVHDDDPTPPVIRPARTDLITDLDTLNMRWARFDSADPGHPELELGGSGSVVAGRGLHLLEAVSEAWGVVVLDGPPGKVVWFSLTVAQAWPYAASCPCAAAAGATVTGRSVTHVPGPWDR